MQRLIVSLLYAVLLTIFAQPDKTWSTSPIAKADSSIAIYVSPTGNDANPGTKQRPLATLAHAQQVVHQLSMKHPERDAVIYLCSGVYHLRRTIVVAPWNSVAAGRTLTFAACPGEKPILSGAVALSSWKKLTDFPVQLPAQARGKVWVTDVSLIRKLKRQQKPSPTVASQMQPRQLFYTLYQQRRRLPRARGEQFTSLRLKKTFGNPLMFAFPDHVLRNWPDLRNAELDVVPAPRGWISNILPMKSVDENKSRAEVAAPCTYSLDPPRQPHGTIENTLAVLDQPGEWVLDSDHDKLYLWPLDDGAPKAIFAPVLTELFRVEGKTNYAAADDQPLENVVIRGLTFTQADRFVWHGQTGWGLQHDWECFDSASAMVRFRGTAKCTVEDCTFSTAGCTGIRFDLYSQNNKVLNNTFEHLGGVGILFAGYGPGTKDVNKHNRIENNVVHHTGELYHGSPGIFIWQSGANRIAHNLIHDLPYSGICVTGRIVWDPLGHAECSQTIRWNEVGGKEIATRFRDKQNRWHKSWTWSEREKWLHSRNNLVTRNDIHDVMQVMDDGNCIYVSGAGGGNTILENYCHDCLSPHMNNAIRCDDDQENTLIKRNIIYRTGGYAEGLLIKGKNTLEENLLVDLRTTGRRHRGYLRFYSGNVAGSVIQRNVFYSCQKGQSPYHGGVSKGGKPAPELRDTKADYNIYYSTVDPEWGTRFLKEQRKYGIELHSVAADPLFVDVAHQKFQFKPESPALKLGLSQPIKLEQVGPQ